VTDEDATQASILGVSCPFPFNVSLMNNKSKYQTEENIKWETSRLKQQDSNHK
jgi:hypothetical protein